MTQVGSFAGLAGCGGSRLRGPSKGRNVKKRQGTPMTGMYEQQRPGIGHNQPEEYAEEKKHEKWERWAKKRTFVRALEGTYSHLYKALLEEKRVYPSNEVPWKGGPGQFGKSVISPQATTIIQSMESHIEAY